MIKVLIPFIRQVELIMNPQEIKTFRPENAFFLPSLKAEICYPENIKYMKIFAKIIFLLIAIISLTISCDKHKNDDKPKNDVLATEDSIYWFIDGLMDYWYLWNDSLPNLDYLDYDSPQDLIEDLIVTRDHWSFVDKEETVNSLFQEGEDFGYGFYLTWDSQSKLRVLFSYPGTAAYTAGIDRGCVIEKINDSSVIEIDNFDFFFSYDPGSTKFDFTDHNGVPQSITLTKEKYYMKGVLFADIYELNNKSVGYIVFQSFLEYAEEELVDAFETFHSAGVSEIIIDLRYNSGGYVSIAEKLANILIPESKVGSVFYTLKHNDDRSPIQDTTVHFRNNSLNLNLNRVFFITNEYSASASELVINCLKPHMDVKTIGNTTYGKPVAMYGFNFQDWLVLPVTAKTINSEGYGDYFEGITPQRKVVDESAFAWGDLNEPSLHQAFYFIENEVFDASAIALKGTRNPRLVKGGGKRLQNNLLIMNR